LIVGHPGGIVGYTGVIPESEPLELDKVVIGLDLIPLFVMVMKTNADWFYGQQPRSIIFNGHRATRIGTLEEAYRRAFGRTASIFKLSLSFRLMTVREREIDEAVRARGQTVYFEECDFAESLRRAGVR
jgi:hypothetical protein